MKKKIILFALALCLTVALAFILSGCTAAKSANALDAEINDNGELVIKFSDGSEKNLGVVVGADGKDGANGKDGADGKDGAPGENGKDGKDGEDGKNGRDGEDGEDGSDGKDGTVDISLNINTDDTAVAAAIAKGLRSTVSIESHYQKTVYNIYTGATLTDYASEGSGVIYTLDNEVGCAYIITNHHVVYDAECNTADKISDNIKVYLYGSEYAEQSFPATYVGGSMYYDIAVLRVDECDALRDEFPVSCTLADSDTISVGETSIAIGNAEGLCISATSGVISVDSENIAMNLADGSGQVSRRVIRIDTSVNHGNSGGPLFNDRGEVIGIVSAKLENDTVDNIGYAIPSNVARAVADNIIDNCAGTETKTVQRVMMGISIIPTDSKATFNTDTGKIEISESTKILTVNEGSAAEGLLFADDILLSATLNEKTKKISRNHHLIDISLDLRVGDTLTLVVLRGGSEVTVDITFDAGDVTDYK